MWAADCDLGIVTRVRFEDHFAKDVGTLHVPDRLWRVEVPLCFAKVAVPDLTKGTSQGRARTDRAQNMSRQRWCCAAGIVVRRHEWRADTR